MEINISSTHQCQQAMAEISALTGWSNSEIIAAAIHYGFILLRCRRQNGLNSLAIPRDSLIQYSKGVTRLSPRRYHLRYRAKKEFLSISCGLPLEIQGVISAWVAFMIAETLCRHLFSGKDGGDGERFPVEKVVDFDLLLAA